MSESFWSEAYWEAVLAADARVPVDADLAAVTTALVTWLGDPSEHRRETLAYPVLATWIGKGVYDDLLLGLGDGISAGLRHGLGDDGEDTVLRRSFSALALTEVLARDNAAQLLPADPILRWGDRVTSWYVREQDLRGFVPGRGWSHPVAHGADALGQLARSRHLGGMEQTAVIDVVADRLLAPTSYAWQHGEDDRLAYAVMAVLHRGDLSLGVLEPWLRRLGGAIRQSGSRTQSHEWPTATAVNTAGFLRALHVQLALGVRGRTDAPGDAALFACPPRDRADLILVVLDQLSAANPSLFGSRAASVVTV